jgi:hypothetical protein
MADRATCLGDVIYKGSLASPGKTKYEDDQSLTGVDALSLAGGLFWFSVTETMMHW